MSIFSKFHIKYPWTFAIITGLIVSFIAYFFTGSNKINNTQGNIKTSISGNNTHAQSVSGNIVGGDLIIQGQSATTQISENAKSNKNTSTTTVIRTVKIGGNKNNTESLIGSGNIGNIFSDAQNVFISGNNNKNIVIKDSNSVNLSGKYNVIYIINCKEININGNDNEIYVVEGTTKRKIDGSRNVIKQITTEDFRKLNLL